ncbi:MAG TPA: DoxX family protein [Thermoanaerobaculia bacterium]|jgi:putative oxidoreductase|nr:DoxX family protein [Thermoanaerobaculia bacterium]
MTSIAIDRHDSLTEGAFRRIVATLFATDRSALRTFLRITLGLVMIPHGLQKTIGWFGGYGFEGTMGFFTSIGIPAFLGFLAIAAESAGAIALVAGFTTRIAALGILANMVVAGVMHSANGFMMNWSGTQKGEGFEYHILAGAMALALVIGGAGRWSLDRVLANRIR